MISRKRSYNHRLKSRKLRKTGKSIKKLSIGGRLGTGEARPCEDDGYKCEPRCITSFKKSNYTQNGEHLNPGEWKDHLVCTRKPFIYAVYNGSNPKFLGKNLKELYDMSIDTNQSLFDDYKNGFSLRDIKKSGLFTNYSLREYGYTAKDFRDIMKEKEKMGSPYNKPQFIKKTIKKLLDAKFTLSELKIGGFTAAEFKIAEIKANDLLNIGFTFLELIEGGYTAAEFKISKINVMDLHKSEITILQLMRIGYDLDELKSIGLSLENPIEGFNSDSESFLGWDRTTACNNLRKNKFTAKQLFTIGFTSLELINAGYNAKEFLDAGITIKGLTPDSFKGERSYIVNLLHNRGFTAKDLKDIGFTPIELINTGYNAKHFADAGLTLNGLTPDSFKGERSNIVILLHNLGFTAKDLKDIGFTPIELINTEYKAKTSEEYKNAGYNAKDFTDAGLTLNGLTPDSFKGERSNIVMLLHNRGFTARNLVDIGFTPIELINTEYKAEKFEAYKNAGYNAKDFTDDDITLKGLTPDSFKGEVPKILKLLQHRKFDLKHLDLSALINKGTIEDFFNHNNEIIKQYESERRFFYNNSAMPKLNISQEIFLPIKWTSGLIFNVDAFSNLIFIDDLRELKYTLKVNEQKYITKDNLYNLFREGLLTYGETKQKVKEIDDKLKDDQKKKIDKLKEKCKFPLKNSVFGTHTNPLCRFKPKLNSKSDTSDEERYEDINTNEKGV